MSLDTCSFVCYIASRLLQLGPGICSKEGHGQFTTGSERCSASDLDNPETPAWSFTAVAWWSALADDSTAVQYKLAMTVHRCLHYRAPRYLADCCVPVSEVFGCQHLCSACHHKLTIPRFRRSTFGTRAFSVAGPTVWNSLPDSLRDSAVVFERFRWQHKQKLLQRWLVMHCGIIHWDMVVAMFR